MRKIEAIKEVTVDEANKLLEDGWTYLNMNTSTTPTIYIMAKVIEGLYYSESHEYLKVEGNIGVIGITDYAQHALGNVVYVDMPDVDDEVEAGAEFGAVESVKAASDLNSPVSGTVVEVNEVLEDAPELINKDAYENWIIKVEMSDESELENLMDAAAYEEFCKE